MPTGINTAANNLHPSRGGLEVFNRQNQKWEAIIIPVGENCFVVNAGDLWEIWTAGKWHSPLHRVSPFGSFTESTNRLQKSDEDNSNNHGDTNRKNNDRLSLVYFSGPRETCLISPLITTSSTKTYAAVRSGDHLRMKLERTQKM